MGKNIIETLSYSSFFWSLGTTSFRTKEFNYSIEKQLACLDDFWKIPENSNLGWEKKYMAPGQKDIYDIKNRYYDFMRERGLTVGDDSIKYKAAREKTSGLVDLGLINENHRLTEVGRRILEISQSENYSSDNPLLISKDSYVYLKQLLKTFIKTDGVFVRPFVVVLYLLSRLDYLTYEEFTFLAPLCTSAEITEQMIEDIKAIRRREKSKEQIIVHVMMTKENYKKAYQVLMENEANEYIITQIGLNRKSRNYDKPYYPLYLLLKDVFLSKDYSKAHLLYKQTTKVSNVGRYWRKYLFDTVSLVAIKNAPHKHLLPSIFDNVTTEEELKTAFFQMMHLIKNLATLQDYFDLNRRYLNIANVIIFGDEQVKLDMVPKQFFASSIEELYLSAYTPSAELEYDRKMEDICPALKFDKEDVVARLNEELGIELENIDEAYSEVEKRRYDRFKTMVDTRFTDNDLMELLDDFDCRNDDEISKKVTDNADTPTIFEYVLGIIWYKASGYKGRILDYMKLCLDANLLPITHAAGGEADIVYEYAATKDYPAHTLLLEATLAESTNQRRMEMEPVSRHLGNHLLKTGNAKSYCVFASSYLHVNVISDFRLRKNAIYCDYQDPEKYVTGMKIIPLSTNDLRTIVKWDIPYTELYYHFEKAYESTEFHPQKWYDEFVKIDKIYDHTPSLLMAAEDIFIYGSIPVDLPNIKREALLNKNLNLILMYAIGPSARPKTEAAGRIAIGIKEDMLKDEQLAAYKSLKYLLFHYWSNPRAYLLTKEPLLVDPDNVPSGYLKRMENDAVKYLLLEYDPQSPSNIGNIDVLKTQRRGEIRYLPFVTTIESIAIDE
ncbi:MAG: AlwI family type II restriction endonuclease [Bacteroidales bacterium]|nr:AlwI family type II restriction endonuclease [Bacteroidales bacterium]